MPTKKDDAAQLDRFKETARQLGCDEDEAAFAEKLKQIVKAKSKSQDGPAKA